MRWARLIWVLVAGVGVLMFVTDEVASWPYLHAVCHSACHQGEPNAASAGTLQSVAISVDFFAIASVTRDALMGLVWFGVGALIVWHRPRDRGPMVATFFLILFTMNPGNSVGIPAIWQPWLGFFDFLTGFTYVFFGLLMPDGRFVPRWTRWAGLAFVLVTAPSVAFADELAHNQQLSALLQVFIPAVLIATVLWAQVYRYRNVSSWDERRQMKWVLYGVAVSVVGMIVLNIGYAVVPGGTNPGSMYDLSAYWLYPSTNTAIPISIAIAMLRSRLWDVDRVINRTLVYGSLTISLAGLYIGSVIGLQALFRTVTGQSSDLAIAVATLAVAALFNPWRHRVQYFIDRRFYRHKYDASRILATFNATLRDDVDLDHLSADIAAVIHETVNPSYLSLWLRPEATR